MATDATGTAPGLWVKRVGRGERPPRARAAGPAVRMAAERRPSEQAPVAARDAERLEGTGGAGGWARRVARSTRLETPATEALRVAVGTAAARMAEMPTRKGREEPPAGGIGAARAAEAGDPLEMARHEALDAAMSAGVGRAEMAGGGRIAARRAARFGDARTEQRARVEEHR